MTISDDKSCDKYANVAVREIVKNYDVEEVDQSMYKTIIYQCMSDLAKATKRTSAKGKAKSDKGSAKPNYYARFHTACSPNAPPHPLLAGMPINYQPDPDMLKNNPKRVAQLEIYEELHNDKNMEKLNRFTSFPSANGVLTDVVAFVEKEGYEQMVRTALIWFQWLSAKDRDLFISRIKEADAAEAAADQNLVTKLEYDTSTSSHTKTSPVKKVPITIRPTAKSKVSPKSKVSSKAKASPKSKASPKAKVKVKVTATDTVPKQVKQRKTVAHVAPPVAPVEEDVYSAETQSESEESDVSSTPVDVEENGPVKVKEEAESSEEEEEEETEEESE